MMDTSSSHHRNMSTGSDERKKAIALSAHVLGVPWHNMDGTRFVTLLSAFHVADNFISYPLDLIKTRVQVCSSPDTRSLIRGPLLHARMVWSIEGLRGLYRGYIFSSFGGIPSQIAHLGTYTYVKSSLQTWSSKYNQHGTAIYDGQWWKGLWIPFVAGAAADLASTLFWIPCDVITQRLQISDKRYGRSGVKAMSVIIKDEGVRGLYRGSAATILRDLPASGLFWCSYEAFKRGLQHLQSPETPLPSTTSDIDKDTTSSTIAEGKLVWNNCNGSVWYQIRDFWLSQDRSAQFVSGMAAGALTSFVMSPVDIIKTRIQTIARPNDSFFSLLQHVVYSESITALWRGIIPRILVAAPFTALSTLAYEIIILASVKDM